MQGSQVTIKRGVPVDVLNLADANLEDVAGALPRDQRPLADALRTWHRQAQPSYNARRGTMLDRDRYLTPDSYFKKVRTARNALKDDVIGGAADGTEAIAFSSLKVLSRDEQEEDIGNQISADLNFDDLVRRCWREQFTASAFTIAIWWGQQDFKVRGKTKGGNQSRKTFPGLTVPLAVSVLDSAKIVPVGTYQWGEERLCYVADPEEAVIWDELLVQRDGGVPGQPGPGRGRGWRKTMPRRLTAAELAVVSPRGFSGANFVDRFVIGRYEPSHFERQELLADGVPCDSLFLLDSSSVIRHTRTKGDYVRFPEVRLESTFEILDQKAQLRAMDRALLIGAANYLIIVKRGDKDDPAKQPEVDQTRAGFSTIAQLPVIVSDHRLSVEILTPKLDVSLNREKYDTIDSRLFARAWGSMVPTGADMDDPIKLGRVIGQGLESQRRMLRRTLERAIWVEILKRNEQISERFKLRFSPSQIALAFDPAMLSFLSEARSMREVSRETSLSQFDIDQGDEALLLEREKERFDPIFQTIFNAYGRDPGGEGGEGGGTPQSRAQAGRRQGGRRNGGGAAPGTNQGGQQAPEQLGRRGRRQRPERQQDMDSVDSTDTPDEEDDE